MALDFDSALEPLGKPVFDTGVKVPSVKEFEIPDPTKGLTGGAGSGTGSGSGKSLFGKTKSGRDLTAASPEKSILERNINKVNSAGGVNGWSATTTSTSVKTPFGSAVQVALPAGQNMQQSLDAMEKAAEEYVKGMQAQLQPDTEAPATGAQTEQTAEQTAATPQTTAETQTPPAPVNVTKSENGATSTTEIKSKTFASKSRTTKTLNQQASEPAAEQDKFGDVDNSDQDADAFACFYSKYAYGVDVDDLADTVSKDYKNKTYGSDIAAKWLKDIKTFISYDRRAHTEDLSNKDIEAWQGVANRLVANRNTYRLFSGIVSESPFLNGTNGAVSADVLTAIRNAVVSASDQKTVDRYVPGLWNSSAYRKLREGKQLNDLESRQALAELGKLFAPLIQQENAEENDKSAPLGISLLSPDLWKRNFFTAANQVDNALVGFVGNLYDMYLSLRIETDQSEIDKMTPAERAENDDLLAERRINMRVLKMSDDATRDRQEEINAASDVYTIQERINRGRNIVNNREQDSGWGAFVNFLHAPFYTATTQTADSAGSVVGMLAAAGTGYLTGGIGGALLAGAGAGAIAIGPINAVDDAGQAANRPVAELMSDNEAGNFLATQLGGNEYDVKADIRNITTALLADNGLITLGLASDDPNVKDDAQKLSDLIAKMPVSVGKSDEHLSKSDVLAFYRNPLVAQTIEDNKGLSDVVDKYRQHIFSRTIEVDRPVQYAIGALEGILSPIARNTGVAGIIADAVNKKLLAAGVVPFYRNGLIKGAYAVTEGAVTEGIETAGGNASQLTAEGRPLTYKDVTKGVGQAVVAGGVLGGTLMVPHATVATYKHFTAGASGASGDSDAGGNGGGNPPSPNPPSPFSHIEAGFYQPGDPNDRSADYDAAAEFATALRSNPDIQTYASQGVPPRLQSDTPIFGNVVRPSRDIVDGYITAVNEVIKETDSKLSQAHIAGDIDTYKKLQAFRNEAAQVRTIIGTARRFYRDAPGSAQNQQGRTAPGAGGVKVRFGSDFVDMADDDVFAATKNYDTSKMPADLKEKVDLLNKYERDNKRPYEWAAVSDNELVRYTPAANGLPPSHVRTRRYPASYVRVLRDGEGNALGVSVGAIYGEWTDDQFQLATDYASYKGWSTDPKGFHPYMDKNGNLGAKFGKKASGITFDQMRSEMGQSQGTQSQGTQSQGTQSQGTQSQGTQSQGAQSQGTQSQGQEAPAPKFNIAAEVQNIRNQCIDANSKLKNTEPAAQLNEFAQNTVRALRKLDRLKADHDPAGNNVDIDAAAMDLRDRLAWYTADVIANADPHALDVLEQNAVNWPAGDVHTEVAVATATAITANVDEIRRTANNPAIVNRFIYNFIAKFAANADSVTSPDPKEQRVLSIADAAHNLYDLLAPFNRDFAQIILDTVTEIRKAGLMSVLSRNDFPTEQIFSARDICDTYIIPDILRTVTTTGEAAGDEAVPSTGADEQGEIDFNPPEPEPAPAPAPEPETKTETSGQGELDFGAPETEPVPEQEEPHGNARRPAIDFTKKSVMDWAKRLIRGTADPKIALTIPEVFIRSDRSSGYRKIDKRRIPELLNLICQALESFVRARPDDALRISDPATTDDGLTEIAKRIVNEYLSNENWMMDKATGNRDLLIERGAEHILWYTLNEMRYTYHVKLPGGGTPVRGHGKTLVVSDMPYTPDLSDAQRGRLIQYINENGITRGELNVLRTTLGRKQYTDDWEAFADRVRQQVGNDKYYSTESSVGFINWKHENGIPLSDAEEVARVQSQTGGNTNGTKSEERPADTGSDTTAQQGGDTSGGTDEAAGPGDSEAADGADTAAESSGNVGTDAPDTGAAEGTDRTPEPVSPSGEGAVGPGVSEQPESGAAQTGDGTGSPAGEGGSSTAGNPDEAAAGESTEQPGNGDVNADDVATDAAMDSYVQQCQRTLAETAHDAELVTDDEYHRTHNGVLAPDRSGYISPKHGTVQREYDTVMDTMMKFVMPMYMTLRALSRRFKRKGYGNGFTIAVLGRDYYNKNGGTSEFNIDPRLETDAEFTEYKINSSETVDSLNQKYGADYAIRVRTELLSMLKAACSTKTNEAIKQHIRKDANGQLFFTDDIVTIDGEQYSMFDLMRNIVPAAVVNATIHEFAHALADIAVHEAQYNKDNKEISGLQRTVNWAVNAFYDAVNGVGTAKQSLTRYAMSQEIFAVGIEMAVQRIMLFGDKAKYESKIIARILAEVAVSGKFTKLFHYTPDRPTNEWSIGSDKQVASSLADFHKKGFGKQRGLWDKWDAQGLSNKATYNARKNNASFETFARVVWQDIYTDKNGGCILATMLDVIGALRNSISDASAVTYLASKLNAASSSAAPDINVKAASMAYLETVEQVLDDHPNVSAKTLRRLVYAALNAQFDGNIDKVAPELDKFIQTDIDNLRKTGMFDMEVSQAVDKNMSLIDILDVFRTSAAHTAETKRPRVGARVPLISAFYLGNSHDEYADRKAASESSGQVYDAWGNVVADQEATSQAITGQEVVQLADDINSMPTTDTLEEFADEPETTPTASAVDAGFRQLAAAGYDDSEQLGSAPVPDEEDNADVDALNEALARYAASDMKEEEAKRLMDEANDPEIAERPDPFVPLEENQIAVQSADPHDMYGTVGADGYYHPYDSLRTGTDPYDMYGVTTVADVQQYAGIWAKLAARVTQAVQNFSVRRKAMQAQAEGAVDVHRMFRENKAVRWLTEHMTAALDRSDAPLRLFFKEVAQGTVDPNDNYFSQALTQSKREVLIVNETGINIFQHGVTMNENGETVRITDENGQPVESVLQLVSRYRAELRKRGVKKAVFENDIALAKDLGMYRTLLHTIEANDALFKQLVDKYELKIKEYDSYKTAGMTNTPEAKTVAAELASLGKNIIHFQKMMDEPSMTNVSKDDYYTMPAGGRTITMARNEIQALLKKYDDALAATGMDQAARQQFMHQMFSEFNRAYNVAINEFDRVMIDHGILSEADVAARHQDYKFYTPLRGDISAGRGRPTREMHGAIKPASDAVTNYAAQVLRTSEISSQNTIGMALYDLWNKLKTEYERIKVTSNDPVERMKIISHQTIGRIKSYNGLMVVTSDDMAAINKELEKLGANGGDLRRRLTAFEKHSVYVNVVVPTSEEDRQAGVIADTVTKNVWIGFDPDPIGRAELTENDDSSRLNGIQNFVTNAAGERVYPAVQPRDYSAAGDALYQATYRDVEKSGPVLKLCGLFTLTASQAMTTYNVAFAPKSAWRDLRERIQYLFRHDYKGANGQKVNGMRIAVKAWRLLLNPSFLSQGARASIALISGKESHNFGNYAAYVNEMHRLGVLGGVQQQYTATGTSRQELYGKNALDRITEEVAAQEADGITKRFYKSVRDSVPAKALGLFGRMCRKLHQIMLGYSNFFYNMPIAVQYVAMREMGCSERTAAAATMDAMDFLSRGKSHKKLARIVPFFTSITHGAVNLLNSYGLSGESVSSNPELKKSHYQLRMMGRSYAAKCIRLAALSGIVSVMYALVGAMCRPDDPDDDKTKGQRLMDNIPLRNMSFIPLPLLQMLGITEKGDNFMFKAVGGFGEDSLAMILAWGIDRYVRGKATGMEVLGAYTVNFVKNASPMDLPMFDASENPMRYGAYTLGKSIPVVAWMSDAIFNITYSGRTLDGELSKTATMRGYEERNAYVDTRYREIAEALYKTTGGMLDMTPATIKAMVDGVSYGPIIKSALNFIIHIGDETPKSVLDPNYENANLEVYSQFLGLTSLGNKFPDTPYLFISQLQNYFDGLLKSAGVDSLLKGDPGVKGSKEANIRAAFANLELSDEETADYVNMYNLRKDLKPIVSQMNDLVAARRAGLISADDFINAMNELNRQGYELRDEFMKNSYYYRGIYDKRASLSKDVIDNVENLTGIRSLERGLQATEDIGE